jgi:hypothetical protein
VGDRVGAGYWGLKIIQGICRGKGKGKFQPRAGNENQQGK